MTCEKCWGDAYVKMMLLGGSQADRYQLLIKARHGCPCSPKEQAGQFWDDERGLDRRLHAGAQT